MNSEAGILQGWVKSSRPHNGTVETRQRLEKNLLVENFAKNYSPYGRDVRLTVAAQVHGDTDVNSPG